MKKRTWFQSFLSFVIILGISSLLYLYTAGYRLTKKDNKQIDLTKTGMISAKSIPQGASVVWINLDSAPHTVVSEAGAEIQSDRLSQGNTYAHTFNLPGIYDYYCSIHPSMKGKIQVR